MLEDNGRYGGAAIFLRHDFNILNGVSYDRKLDYQKL